MKKLKIKFTPEAAKLLKKFHPESKKLIKIPPDTSTWGCLNLFTIHPPDHLGKREAALRRTPHQ
jgi:hypothetical protein